MNNNGLEMSPRHVRSREHWQSSLSGAMDTTVRRSGVDVAV